MTYQVVADEVVVVGLNSIDPEGGTVLVDALPLLKISAEKNNCDWSNTNSVIKIYYFPEIESSIFLNKSTGT